MEEYETQTLYISHFTSDKNQPEAENVQLSETNFKVNKDGQPSRVAAFDLRHFDFPVSGRRCRREGKSQSGAVSCLVTNVNVH